MPVSGFIVGWLAQQSGKRSLRLGSWSSSILRSSWLPLLIFCLSAGLRLYRLDGPALWYDETFTALLAGLPLRSMLLATAGDVHPPLFYLIEWASRFALGNSAAAIRLPSALFSSLAAVQLYRLVEKLDNRIVGGLAGLLFAVMPGPVVYGQEGRSYALLTLLILVAAESALSRRTLRTWLSLALALYTHNLAVLYIVVIVGYLYWTDRKSALKTVFKISLVYLPWLPVLVSQVIDVGDGFWPVLPSIGALFQYPLFVTFGVIVPPFAALHVTGLSLGISGLALLAALRDGRRWGLMAALATLPPLLLYLVSRLWTPIYLERALVPAGAALIGLWAHWVAHLPKFKHTAALLLMLPILAGSLVGQYAYHTAYDYDFRLPAQMIDDQWSDCDVIYHGNLVSYIMFEYYAPGRNVVMPGAGDLAQSLSERTKRAMGIRQAELADLTGQYCRAWVVVASTPQSTDAEPRRINAILSTYPVTYHRELLNQPLVKLSLYRVQL